MIDKFVFNIQLFVDEAATMTVSDSDSFVTACTGTTCTKVTLNSNITLTGSVGIAKTLEIDLNGFEITNDTSIKDDATWNNASKAPQSATEKNYGSDLINVLGNGKLTISDSSQSKSGKITAKGLAVYNNKTGSEYGSNNRARIAVCTVTDSSELIVNGGTIEGLETGIWMFGTGANCKVTVNGGTIKGTPIAESKKWKNEDSLISSRGIQNAHGGTLTIKGDVTITGDTGVEVRGGTLKVEADEEGNAPKITAGYSPTTATSYALGEAVAGAGIGIAEHKDGSGYKIDVDISAGTIKGYTALAIVNPEFRATTLGYTVKVNGGEFESTGEGKNAVEYADGRFALTVTDGTFKGNVELTGTKYQTDLQSTTSDADVTNAKFYGGTLELAQGDSFIDANGVKYTASSAATVTLTADNTSNPAKISKVEFGNTGIVVATLPTTSGLTLDNVQYLSGESETATANDTVTITNGKVSAVGTGKVKAVIGKTAASTNGVTIDGVTYNSTDTTKGGTVVFDNGKASVGTTAGVVTATITKDSKNGVVADNITYTGKGGTVVLTTTGDTPATAATISDDSTGTIVATFAATVSTNGITVGKLKYTGAATTDSVTFEKTAYSTSKGNITATTTGALTGDEELRVAGNTYKVTDDGTMTFTLKDNVLVGIADLSTTSDSISGDFTSLKTINGATGTITISGDKDVQLVGSTTTGQVSEVKNVGGTVTITGAAVAAANITTDNVGSFKLGNTSAITLAGTDSVVGFTLAESAVTAVTGFDAAGTISGNLNGIAFTSAAAIGDTAKLNITKDTDFAVVNDGTDLSLANISNGAVISNAGGMTKVVTDEAGTFSFGTSQKVTVTGDTSINFTLGDNSTVTAVDSIASATLSVSSDTTSISINGGDAITFAAADKKTPTFVIDSAGKITEVSGASLVSGLTGDVNVIETSSAKIGTTDINITDDSSYAVSVVSGAVGEISSVSANATISSMSNATINTDSNGKFTFGTTGYEVAGDTEVQFVTGEQNGTVSAINGLEGTVKTTDKEITINGDAVKIEVASADADSIVTYTGGITGIASITGLTNNATVTGAKDAALNLVGTSSTSVATSLTANGNLFQLLNDSDGVTITGGEIVTGLGSGASLVAANAGTYTVNGTELNVAAGETIRGTSEGTAEIYSAENVSEVDSVTAASVESLASALGIDTSDYATVANDAVEAAISSSASTADKSALDGNMKFAVSVPSGSSSQDVDLSANTGVKDITLTTGNQTLKFNNEGGNVAQVGAEAKGTKDIELGAGGDIAIIAKGTKATVNVVAGKGSDSIVSGANASVDVGNGGATKVRAIGGATVTMNNYNAADSKAGVQTTNSDIAAAIGNGNITLENGVIGTSEGKVALNSGSASADVVSSADLKNSTEISKKWVENMK